MRIMKAFGLALPLVVLSSLVGRQEIAAQGFTFFVVPEGPTWGADRPAVGISDQNCQDIAYAAGYGDPTWRAYLDGSEAEGEGDEVASERIGAGPWYNYHGVLIAENLEQLHSDQSNLNQGTALTITGASLSPDVFAFPPGSELDAGDFTREGPYLCFGIP
jgi:hypothetical protein